MTSFTDFIADKAPPEPQNALYNLTNHDEQIIAVNQRSSPLRYRQMDFPFKEITLHSAMKKDMMLLFLSVIIKY